MCIIYGNDYVDCAHYSLYQSQSGSNRENEFLKRVRVCVCVAFFCGWLDICLQTTSFWLGGHITLRVMVMAHSPAGGPEVCDGECHGVPDLMGEDLQSESS